MWNKEEIVYVYKEEVQNSWNELNWNLQWNKDMAYLWVATVK